MGTVEIIIIVAVLVGVALVFKEGITRFVTNLMNRFFDADAVQDPSGGAIGGGG